jgi:hypothetical protein
MDDISSSRIQEDVIIFSTRKINAWNATIHRRSIVVLGGDREILRDILDYRKATIIKNGDLVEGISRANTTTESHDLIFTSSS